MTNDVPRILVLGSTCHPPEVDAYPWDTLPDDLNVADYPVVILNLSSPFPSTLSLREQVSNQLRRQRALTLAIGPPFHRHPGMVQHLGSWLPHVVDWNDQESGTEICEIRPAFAYFFEHVERWRFHCELSSGVASTRPLAKNAYGKALGFELSFGPNQSIVWLPPPTKISTEDAINLILREKYGLVLTIEEPGWVSRFSLPQQKPIEAQIEDTQQKIAALEITLENSREQLSHERRFLKLLYEQGETLQTIVLGAFKELGDQQFKPERKGSDDGQLRSPTGKLAVLEIKGRPNGSLKREDVRQLDDWVDKLKSEHQEDAKGLLIPNMFFEHPVEKRTKKKMFPHDAVKKAAQQEQCILPTTQLFRAVCDKQRGRFDADAFWRTLFSTNGVAALPEPVPDDAHHVKPGNP